MREQYSVGDKLNTVTRNGNTIALVPKNADILPEDIAARLNERDDLEAKLREAEAEILALLRKVEDFEAVAPHVYAIARLLYVGPRA